MTMNDYNIYDFISFPDRAIRDRARAEYFDVQKLKLCADVYKKNNPIASESTLKIKKNNECISIDGRSDESLTEALRRINNQVAMSDLTLLSLYSYYNNLQEYPLEDKRYALYEILYRYECMHACLNYYNIQEKYKSIIRTIYKMDPEKTKTNKAFLKAIKKIKNKPIDLENFYQVCLKIHNNKDYQFVISIRNDETHNIPCLDEIIFKKKDRNGVSIFGTYYVKDNKKLYDGIKGAYIAMLDIKNAVQNIIDNLKE